MKTSIDGAENMAGKLSFQTISTIAMGLALLTTSVAMAQETVTLRVGDRAPQFKVGKWVKGKPISQLAAGHPYVVEFWATRCGPCVAGIPHLSTLAKKYQGKLDIAAISVQKWQDGSPNDTHALVDAFMKTSKGQAMKYHVAMDTDTGFMVRTWLGAAGIDGIPCAFLVDRHRRIAWIGAPTELDAVLSKMFAKG